MYPYAETAMWMNASAEHGTEAASCCPARRNHSASHTALILDTMVMVSIFVILGVVVEFVLVELLLLAGVLLIMLARIIRAEAPKRRLLTI